MAAGSRGPWAGFPIRPGPFKRDEEINVTRQPITVTLKAQRPPLTANDLVVGAPVTLDKPLVLELRKPLLLELVFENVGGASDERANR